MKDKLLALALLLLSITFSRADDIKTVSKTFPVIKDPAPQLSKKLKYDSMMQKWGVGAWWSRQVYRKGLDESRIGNGMEVAICSSDFLAALTNQEAKSKLLNDAEAQTLYEKKIGDYGGKHIAFYGYIQINNDVYKSSDISGEWTFYLFTEDGKRFKPASVTFSRPSFSADYLSHNTFGYRDVTVIFDNVDPDTNKPLLTPETKSLTLALAGSPGQVKAKFVFDPKKK